MAITAAQVKELRDKTGAGMMDAKKALTENDGDMEAAVDWLRTKGLAKAAKKSGRTAAEGLVAVSVAQWQRRGRRDQLRDRFRRQERRVPGDGRVRSPRSRLDATDLDDLKSPTIDGKSVEDTLTDKIAKIGENMSLRRMALLEGENVVSYVHNAAADGMGKIGVLVAYCGQRRRHRRARSRCMSPPPTRPRCREADLDPAIVEREKAGPDRAGPRKRQARAGHREDDRGPDEEVLLAKSRC